MTILQEKALYTVIDKILWEKWDPIGINDEENIRNEYYGYISPVINKILETNNEKELAKLLYLIETDRMGLGGDYEKCLKIAEIIFEAQSHIFKEP